MRLGATEPRKQLLSDQVNLEDPAALLETLEAAHRQFEAAMIALEATASEGPPDASQFGVVRLRISQANLARSQIVRKICTHLLSRTSADEAEAVRELQRRDAQQFQTTSEHIRRWTPDELGRDWEGYTASSRKIRAELREIIVAEKAIFYPLLRSACVVTAKADIGVLRVDRVVSTADAHAFSRCSATVFARNSGRRRPIIKSEVDEPVSRG